MENDLAYFRRRASEERTAAMRAAHAEARRRHREFAERYEDLVRGMIQADCHSGLKLVQPAAAPPS